MLKRAIKTGILIIATELVASCTLYAPHVDVPSAPPPPAIERRVQLAPLDPRPSLPVADSTPCPIGSGLAVCFTLDQDLARKKRITILHDDDEYCRGAYAAAAAAQGVRGANDDWR